MGILKTLKFGLISCLLTILAVIVALLFGFESITKYIVLLAPIATVIGIIGIIKSIKHKQGILSLVLSIVGTLLSLAYIAAIGFLVFFIISLAQSFSLVF